MFKKSFSLLLLSISLIGCSPAKDRSVQITDSVVTITTAPYQNANVIELHAFILPKGDIDILKKDLPEGLVSATVYQQALHTYNHLDKGSSPYSPGQAIAVDVATGGFRINGTEVGEGFHLKDDYGFDFATKQATESIVASKVSFSVAVADELALVWVLFSYNMDGDDKHALYIANNMQNDSIYTVK